VHGGFALSHSHGFHEYVVVAGGFTQHNGFAGLAGHATEASGRRAGADERRWMHGKTLHAGLVAENRAFGAFA